MDHSLSKTLPKWHKIYSHAYTTRQRNGSVAFHWRIQFHTIKMQLNEITLKFDIHSSNDLRQCLKMKRTTNSQAFIHLNTNGIYSIKYIYVKWICETKHPLWSNQFKICSRRWLQRKTVNRIDFKFIIIHSSQTTQSRVDRFHLHTQYH